MDRQTDRQRPASLFGYKYHLCLQTVGNLIRGDGEPLNKDTLSRLCSSRARWSLAPNFCSWVNRKAQIFHTNHMLGSLDVKGSENWTAFNVP